MGKENNVRLESIGGSYGLIATPGQTDLTMGQVVYLANDVRKLARSADTRFILVDLGRTHWIDSTVLGWFFELHSWATHHNGIVVIVTQNKDHLQVMELTHLTELLHVVRTLTDGLALVGKLVGEEE